jgi:hypothetical protein
VIAYDDDDDFITIYDFCFAVVLPDQNYILNFFRKKASPSNGVSELLLPN